MSATPSVLRAAVVGVGAMGQHHVRVYRELPDVDLVAVVDNDAQARSAIARRYDVRGYAGLVEMLDEARPDVVSVAVPTALHLEVAREIIRHGIHVLIEKPIAATVADGQAIVELAQARNVVLAVGHIERHNPAIQALKRRLDQGALGPIFEMRAERVGPSPQRVRDVGVVLDLATHDIDVICHLAGSPLLRVYAETRQEIHGSREDLLSGMLRFANGVTGILHVNWLTPATRRRLTVTGARGGYEVDYITQDLTRCEHGVVGEPGPSPGESPDHQPYRGVGEGRMIRDKIEKQEPLRLEIDDFLQSVRSGQAPRVTGEEALGVLEVAQALVRSGEHHQVVEMGACAPA